MKVAWINWSVKEERWNIRLWNENAEKWEYIRSYTEVEDTCGREYVDNMILGEISRLLVQGYKVEITY